MRLADGSFGRASVPSGASTGTHEARELRDGGASHEGRGVRRAVAHVGGEIAAALRGLDACGQRAVDARLTGLDGTPRLERLGANAVLGGSLAVCRAAPAGTSSWTSELVVSKYMTISGDGIGSTIINNTGSTITTEKGLIKFYPDATSVAANGLFRVTKIEFTNSAFTSGTSTKGIWFHDDPAAPMTTTTRTSG